MLVPPAALDDHRRPTQAEPEAPIERGAGGARGRRGQGPAADQSAADGRPDVVDASAASILYI